MKYIKLSFALFAAGMILSACGSDGGGGGGAATPKSQTYYLSDGECYRASSNQEVELSRCDNLLFIIEDGECLRKADDVEVAISFCTNNRFFFGQNSCFNRSGQEVDDRDCEPSSSSNGTSADKDDYENKVCDGDYTLFRQDGVYQGQCDGRRGGNCSGLIMFEERTQKFVYCL